MSPRDTAERDRGSMPAVVSSAIVDLWNGASREVEVHAAFPRAAYLEVRDTRGWRMVTVSGSAAVQQPCGVVLAGATADTVLATLRVGARGRIGAGGLQIAGITVRATRWWDPRVRLPVTTAEVLAARAAQAACDARMALERGDARGWGIPALACRLRDAVVAGDGGVALGVTERLVGYGPGLTPAGDDLLAGVFGGVVALVPAVGDLPGAGSTGVAELVAVLADAAVARSRTATTRISSCLLEHAAAGELAGEARALVRALVGQADLVVAGDALIRVGASSGPALLHGLAVAGMLVSAGAPAACGDVPTGVVRTGA